MVQKWSIELLPRSMNYFNHLVKIFITNYACNKPIQKESHQVFSIVQENKEIIESYMNRFKMEKWRSHNVLTP